MRRVLHVIGSGNFSAFIGRLFADDAALSHRFVSIAAEDGGSIPDDAERWLHLPGAAADGLPVHSWLRAADCIVFHFMSRRARRLLTDLEDRQVVVWSGWGADYEDFMPPVVGGLLGKRTRRLLGYSLRSRVACRLNYPPNRLWRGIRRVHDAWLAPRVDLGRIDYFSSPLPAEFPLLQAAQGKTLRAEYLRIPYGSIDETFSADTGTAVGPRLLLGNSASPSNNHADFLDALSDNGVLEEFEIICPLVYGDPRYREAVIKNGRQHFGQRFQPIQERLSLEAYNKILASCRIAVMNHRRQQALGNIGVLILQGTELYLDARNPLFAELRSRGIPVATVTDLLEGKRIPGEYIGATYKARRRFLEELWGTQVVASLAGRLAAAIERALAAKPAKH